MTKGEESRQRLIKCAAELFWKNGYSATGISQILQQTGLPKGSFYFYFKSKDELAIAVAAYYQGQRVYIFEINYDNDTISNTYEWCAEGVSEEIQNLKDMPIDTISRWLAKFEKFGEFYITSVNETLNKVSEEYRILAAQGIKCLIAAPLIENDVIIGFIGVDDPIANMNNLHLLKSITYYIINDIQKRKMLMKLEYMSYIDLLTGVYNRNRYISDLESIKLENHMYSGVLYLDINGLKRINDSFGHRYGDYIIKKAADILCGVLVNQFIESAVMSLW